MSEFVNIKKTIVTSRNFSANKKLIKFMIAVNFHKDFSLQMEEWNNKESYWVKGRRLFVPGYRRGTGCVS